MNRRTFIQTMFHPARAKIKPDAQYLDDRTAFMEEFIHHSGLIDPQPGYPNRKGEIMWDNHVRAFELAEHMARELTIDRGIPVSDTHNIIRDIHRELTRRIEFYERDDLSGQYRKRNVTIGDRDGVNPYLVPTMMHSFTDITLANVEHMNYNYGDHADEEIYDFILYTHNTFQHIHPFMDGNGRTGRLLMFMLCLVLDVEPFIIYEEARQEYYNMIEEDLNARNRQGDFIEFNWFQNPLFDSGSDSSEA